MKYLLMFIGLMILGLGVNYLISHFLKSRLQALKKKEFNPEDDPLILEMKSGIDKEMESLKLVIKELMTEIQLKFQELEKRENILNNLISLADERIEKLSKISEVFPQDTLSLNNQMAFCRIYELYKQGMDRREIAKSLGIGIGEVDLRLGLLNKVSNCVER